MTKPKLLHYSSSYFPRIGGLPVTIRDIAHHTADHFEHHLMTTAQGGVREWAAPYVTFVDDVDGMVDGILKGPFGKGPLAVHPNSVARLSFEETYSWQARKAEFVGVVEGVLC